MHHNNGVVLSANSLIGDDVKNSAGENLGSLKEIMVDLSSGRIRYAVIDFGGFLGIGNKLFAVPWDALSVDTENKHVVFNVEKDVLKQAEGFDEHNWPNFADAAWGTKTYQHYGQEPYWN